MSLEQIMWFSHNLGEQKDFKLDFTPTKFAVMDFHTAAIEAAKKVAELDKPIYVALSGGIDSEYMLQAFINAKIKVTPITILTSGNMKEFEYAEKFCKANNLKQVIHPVSQDQFFAVYQRYVVDAYNCRGWNSVPALIAGMLSTDGVLVIGNHFIDDSTRFISRCNSSTWDWYNEKFFETVSFFTSTPELTYAMVKEIDGSPLSEFKARLFGLEKREKMIPFYPASLQTRMRQITHPDYGSTCYLGRRNVFLEAMEKWNEEASST